VAQAFKKPAHAHCYDGWVTAKLLADFSLFPNLQAVEVTYER